MKKRHRMYFRITQLKKKMRDKMLMKRKIKVEIERDDNLKINIFKSLLTESMFILKKSNSW